MEVIAITYLSSKHILSVSVTILISKMNKAADLVRRMRIDSVTVAQGGTEYGEVWRKLWCNCAELYNGVCRACQGRRFVIKYHQFPFYVNQGTTIGAHIRIADEGNQAPNKDQGDILIRVTGIRLPGEDYDMPWRQCIDINVVEAKCGFRRTLNGTTNGIDFEIVHRGKECIADGEEMVVRRVDLLINGTSRRCNIFIKFRVNPIPKFAQKLGCEIQKSVGVVKPPVPFEAEDGNFLYYDDAAKHELSKMELHDSSLEVFDDQPN